MIDNNVFKWLQFAGAERPVRITFNSPEVKLSLDLIQEEVDELKEAIGDKDKAEVIDAIVDIKWVVNNLIYFSGITEAEIKRAEDEVTRANYSKFCANQLIAENTCAAYQNGTHPDKLGESIDAYFEENNGIFVIKRKSDDKILKSINWKQPVIQIIF